MKTIKYSELLIHQVDIQKGEIYSKFFLHHRYRKGNVQAFSFDEESLKPEYVDMLMTFNSDIHILKLYLQFNDDYTNFKFLDLILDEKRNYVPETELFLLRGYVPIAIDYLEYKTSQNIFYVQKDGFCVMTAPTGHGKTYFALYNSKMLCSKFDLLVYVNLEISKDDISIRYREMHGEDVPENFAVISTDNFERIRDLTAAFDSVAVIVDNIDNLITGGDDAYSKQLSFVYWLDKWCKENKNHALLLTQFVKEGREPLVKAGKIVEEISHNQLSGVKQIATLSRSVIMSAYDSQNNRFLSKFLKKGTGKLNETVRTNQT